MDFFSKDILSSTNVSNKTALFVASVTLTTFASAYNSGGATANQNHATSSTKVVTYTANGTTDKKTAKLFQQLMQNNPNIEVTTQVIHKAKPTRKNNMAHVAVNYTIKGKTDKATARKLIKLFKTSKHIEIVANINQKAASFKQNAYSSFTPYYYNGYQAYYIPPVTNPTIWYRVPAWTQPYPQDNKLDVSKAPFPMDYSLNLATK